MEKIFQVTALCIVGALMAIVLKKCTPELGLLMTLAVSIIAFGIVTEPLKEIFILLDELVLESGTNHSLYVPLYKALGISCVVRIGSCLCRDAGETALATALELAGTVCTLLISVPLIRAVLSLLLELLE